MIMKKELYFEIMTNLHVFNSPSPVSKKLFIVCHLSVCLSVYLSIYLYLSLDVCMYVCPASLLTVARILLLLSCIYRRGFG
jgi:hypothetical protein